MAVVALTMEPTEDVAVVYAVKQEDQDYVELATGELEEDGSYGTTQTLTFTATNWNVPQKLWIKTKVQTQSQEDKLVTLTQTIDSGAATELETFTVLDNTTANNDIIR